MSHVQFNRFGLPSHHANLLLVRSHPELAATLATGGARAMFDSTLNPGIDLLVRMARFGAVRRVTPLESPPRLAQDGEAPFPLGSIAALGGPFAAPLASWARSSRLGGVRSRARRALAGSVLVEFESPAAAQEAGEQLRADASIESASPVPARYLLVPGSRRRAAVKKAPAARPAAVPPAGPLWNLRAIRWAEARAKPGFREADQVTVAVLDTGVDAAHPDLAGRVAAYHHQDPDGGRVIGPEDIVGHGTHVSGIVAADSTNGFGVEGICRPQLEVWKIFTDQPLLIPSYRAYLYVVDPVLYLHALADCADQQVAVMNLSIGGGAAPDPVESELFSTPVDGGTTVVAAMGNERKAGSPISYPAAIPGVVAVGATKIDDGVAPFSNRGPHIALAAPGVAIWSTLPTYPGRSGYDAVPDGAGGWKEGKPEARDTDYDAWAGTSMATPHVTAAAALLHAAHGPMSAAEVKAALMSSADKVPGMGGADFHPDFGAGRLNLERLL